MNTIPIKDRGVSMGELPVMATYFSICGCTMRCEECHSPELWTVENASYYDARDFAEYAKSQRLDRILFMGGLTNGDKIAENFLSIVKELSKDFKVSLYHGGDDIPEGILPYLEYIKVGSYKKECGGLESETTNQRLYRVKDAGSILELVNMR